jgi:hypothetical protein
MREFKPIEQAIPDPVARDNAMCRRASADTSRLNIIRGLEHTNRWRHIRLSKRGNFKWSGDS